ncbi:MAG: hypothetical protein H6828_08405 [Planctomycetes bacterium]|nr:hypothetical protein [Planctomycetota bacterium]
MHCAAFEPAPGPAWARAADVPLSARALPRDDERRATSAALVRAMRAALPP